MKHLRQLEIENILKNSFYCCYPQEIWNGCSSNDEYGYIDVAIVFVNSPEIRNLLGDLLLDDPERDDCWLWACANSKGGRSTKYHLTGQESAPRIDGRTALAKAINSLYGTAIRQAKIDFYKELKEE